MVWGDETIRLLRQFWAEGLSTAEIGRRLGTSKNAIVGKAHRLELDARPSPIRREASKPGSESVVAATTTLPPLRSTVPLPLPAARPVAPSPQDPARLLRAVPDRPRPVAVTPPPAPSRTVSQSMQLRRPSVACCWPIGEPGTKTFRFCDDAAVAGKPYCEDHVKVAYVRIKDRKENAA